VLIDFDRDAHTVQEYLESLQLHAFAVAEEDVLHRCLGPVATETGDSGLMLLNIIR